MRDGPNTEIKSDAVYKKVLNRDAAPVRKRHAKANTKRAALLSSGITDTQKN
jgi:hypothetical protein